MLDSVRDERYAEIEAEQHMSDPTESAQSNSASSIESSSSYRRADIIVLLMVAVILGALVAPVIYAAREAARRDRCAFHLRGLSLGVQAYADVYTQFPLGTV